MLRRKNIHVQRTALFLSLVAVFCSTVQAKERGQPNIIVILLDDLGYSDLGAYGGEINTPNIDRLAGDGLRFTQAYNAARCCPSRAALMSGLYSHQAGLADFTGPTLCFDHFGSSAIRKGDWKLVRCNKRLNDRTWELYNIANDRCETEDLMQSEPGRFLELKEEWLSWAERVKS